MFPTIKDLALEFISEKLGIKSLVDGLMRESADRESFNGQVNSRLAQFEVNLRALQRSMIPVVLFKGTMVAGGKRYADYSFAAQAVKAAENSGSKDYIINIQPDCTLCIKSLTILNGVCDIVECRWCNMDMLPHHRAAFPYDSGEIIIDSVEGLEVTPANRIYIRLAKRPLD